MKKIFVGFLLALFVLSAPSFVHAQNPRDESLFDSAEELESTVSAEVTVSPTPTPEPLPRVDITQPTKETVGPLEALLDSQEVDSVLPLNFFKVLIRNSVQAGVPANTIVLLLLLPLIVALIAGARHIIGLRGFGIFLPAALSIVFVAIGPIIGIILFMVIVLISTYARIVMRKMKLKLQYLPRMSMILWFVVLGVLSILFLAPLIGRSDFANVSIFPVLILVLLAEDFSKVQLGKSARTAIALATETILMALVAYVVLTFEFLQRFALLNPEITLISVIAFDVLLGKYVGLRVVEYWRYRKLILKNQ